MTISVEGLRKTGCKVYISHVRKFGLEFQDKNGEWDDCGTRADYESYFSECNLAPGEPFSYANNVNACGGFTVVDVVLPDGERFHAKHNFGKSVNFDKKKGVKLALEKLVGRNKSVFSGKVGV